VNKEVSVEERESRRRRGEREDLQPAALSEGAGVTSTKQRERESSAAVATIEKHREEKRRTEDTASRKREEARTFQQRLRKDPKDEEKEENSPRDYKCSRCCPSCTVGKRGRRKEMDQCSFDKLKVGKRADLSPFVVGAAHLLGELRNSRDLSSRELVSVAEDAER